MNWRHTAYLLAFPAGYGTAAIVAAIYRTFFR